MSRLPPELVHHVASELLERFSAIKHTPNLIREISPFPLPAAYYKTLETKAKLSQWRVQPTHTTQTWLQKINPFQQNIEDKTPNELLNITHQPEASLVLAPLVLDYYDDVLKIFAQLPQWFSSDGVLLFSTLGAGGLPELVNAQPEWLELLHHWPNIMDAGARLQELRFDLPVLDVEAIHLSYTNFDSMWHDICAFIPHLDHNETMWQTRLQTLYDEGLRQLSLQILYVQVWQALSSNHQTKEHTISLESLTAQLHHQKTFGHPD